jgi:hypothetical protein
MNQLSKDLYEGKFFYEIMPEKYRGNDKSVNLTLIGPLDNIRYISSKGGPGDYKFVQVVDGKPVRAFRADEILVTEVGL